MQKMYSLEMLNQGLLRECVHRRSNLCYDINSKSQSQSHSGRRARSMSLDATNV